MKPDLGIVGDGGETFALLVERPEASESYRDLPGLVSWETGEIAYSGQPASSSFAKPPRLEDLDLARYRQAGFGIGVLTKLGDFYYPAAGSEQAGRMPPGGLSGLSQMWSRKSRTWSSVWVCARFSS